MTVTSHQTPGMSAEDYRQAHVQDTLSGGRTSGIPYSVFCPDVLRPFIERHDEARRKADDAQIEVELAKAALTTARSQAVTAAAAGEEVTVDFGKLEEAIRRAEVKAEGLLRPVRTAESALLAATTKAYPEWRGYLLEAFEVARQDVDNALARLRHAERVREDMLGAVLMLDRHVGAKLRPLADSEGFTKRQFDQMAPEYVRGAAQRRNRALSQYVEALIVPRTFAWKPED